MTTMSLLLLLVTTSAATSSLERAKKTSDPNQWNYDMPGSGCSYRGRTYNKGAVILGANRCSKMKCNNGILNYIEIKCLYNNMCYGVGDSVRGGRNGCHLFKCQANEQFMAVTSDPYKCRDAFNRCRICQG
ncbi:uncharacterized protein LOC124134356 [Haliotis rufescens]|uniref:uncharacterized protein LOC124134356 n=1 Tax=Haliotis rufescens TaxID=6454 RepID=UPI00201F786D|nr:uncharacterized protein LOC124134356 [Haliotis rufescens]